MVGRGDGAEDGVVLECGIGDGEEEGVTVDGGVGVVATSKIVANCLIAAICSVPNAGKRMPRPGLFLLSFRYIALQQAVASGQIGVPVHVRVVSVRLPHLALSSSSFLLIRLPLRR